MKPIPRTTYLLPVIAALLASSELEADPTFKLLGDLPGGSTFSEALGVSADGSFVVGVSSSASSGAYDPDVAGSPTEGFIWDAASETMLGIGDLPGGRFSSRALDVSADGRIVVGDSEATSASAADPRRSLAVRWTRGGSPALVALETNQQFLFKEPALSAIAGATGVSDDGEIVVGTVTWLNGTTLEEVTRGFYWWRGLGLTFVDLLPQESTVTDVSPDAKFLVGSGSAGGPPTHAFRFPLDGRIISGPREELGQLGSFPTIPTRMSKGGEKIVGEFEPASGPRGTFLYSTGQETPYARLAQDGNRPVGISGDGRVVVDAAGGMYLDGQGPFDLRKILAEAGLRDLLALPPALFRVHALSTDGRVVVGGALIDGAIQAWRARLSDCDENGLPDELERLVFASGEAAGVIASGSQRFAASRETLGYGDMISQYGKPWKPGTGRVPESDPTQPAEFLRAALRLEVDDCRGPIRTVAAAGRYLTSLGFPSVNEIQAFEMLLGNEALADAIDPTIGLDGISADDLSGEFAFKGLSGVQDLLDEELALLRGRALPGSPADWLNETIYYPEFKGPGDAARRVAVYNRLPPNATLTGGAAYRSNYRVADNYEAAGKFPQGHGDAYGHYLSAFKSGLDLLSFGPRNWPEEFLGAIVEVLAANDPALEVVRHLAEAGAGRARAAAQVTDLLYRRDYRESADDPHAGELFADPDPQRAWSMGEWARRGAMGAYVDWAFTSRAAPTDPAKGVRRDNLPELDELAGAVSLFQERLDTAGGGLDPLGLVQNVVPFGIDASGLDATSGRSHYEQVRDAATRAVGNARKAFEVSNQAGQRLRDTDKALSEFADHLDDTKADLDQKLIEIFGFPSPDDPMDNDLDPTTGNAIESQTRPDLTNFLATDEALAAAGMRPRIAPGQVQIALSELRVAALRVDQAELALSDLGAQIQSQADRISLLADVQLERVKIITKAGDDQMALTDRAAQIADRKKASGLFGSFTSAVLAGIAGDPQGLINLASQLASDVADSLLTYNEGQELNTEFDIERERTRVQTWKEIELQGLDGRLAIDAETRALNALLRKSPQLLIDITAARELASQALGRLRQAVQHGRMVLRERRRLVARTEGDLVEARWQDMSFRIFRNAALKNYRAFFDIAARYVVLTARAFAYEFDARSDGEDVLSGIYRERRLGGAAGLDGGLQGVLNRLDGAVTVNNFNRPLESLGERTFSLRRNLLGIGVEDFPADDLRFRGFLESRIVDRLEDTPEIQELAQVSVERDYGPAIVITFATEIDSRNFFGRGPELPFGNSNFSLTRNAKIRTYAIRLDGVDASLGTDPESGSVFVYLLPTGDSVLREKTNRPRIEDELITPWAVVDQFLPPPPLADIADFSRRAYNPWRSAAQAGGNYLNALKRQRDSEAQIELGQSEAKTRFNNNLAGRSVWNTRWLLVIPGSQWTSSSEVSEIRAKLLQFIYGTTGDPSRHVGITDIRFIIRAYSH